MIIAFSERAQKDTSRALEPRCVWHCLRQCNGRALRVAKSLSGCARATSVSDCGRAMKTRTQTQIMTPKQRRRRQRLSNEAWPMSLRARRICARTQRQSASVCVCVCECRKRQLELQSASEAGRAALFAPQRSLFIAKRSDLALVCFDIGPSVCVCVCRLTHNDNCALTKARARGLSISGACKLWPDARTHT